MSPEFVAACYNCYGKGTKEGFLGTEMCKTCKGLCTLKLEPGQKYYCGWHNEFFILDKKTWERHKTWPHCLPVPALEWSPATRRQ